MKLKRSSPDSHSSTLPGTLLPLLLALAGIAAAAALIWFALFGPSNQRYEQDMAQAYAQQQAGALNRAMAQIEADVETAAANPQLQVTLQQGTSPTLQRLMRYMYADSLAVYTHLPGEAQPVEDSQAPLSFAALDMIRRAERGMPVPLEAHQVSNQWKIYAVRPLRVSPNASIGGTLAVVFELQRLASALPELPPEAGGVTLIQRFPGAPEQHLIQRGSGSGEAIRLPTTNPAWFIEFRPGPALVSGLINPLWLAGAALLALAGALAALLWLQREWTRSLQVDAATLNQLTLGHKAAGLKLGPLEPVGQSIMSLASRSGQKVGPNPEVVREPAAAPKHVPAPHPPVLAEPEILDTDILDGEGPFDMTGTQTQVSAAPELPAEIFRAYDIRGVVGKTLSEEYLYWLGRSIGSETIAAGQPRIAVGRDGRLSGPVLMEQLIRGLMESGCQVVDLGMVPTPVVYFATATTDATSGVVLTGSHNPADYNGLKVVIAGQTLASERIQALHARLRQNDLSHGFGSREQLDLLPTYIQHIVDDVVLARPLKVVIDCGNGVAGVVAQALLEELGCTVIALYCDVDGTFPNHHPDPGKPENLAELIAQVRQHEADIGLAFDGDADRLVVVTSDGEMIYPDRLLMLLAEDVLARQPGADIVFDIKCSRRLPALISRVGGRPVMWKSGHSMIKAKMQETGALLGGEMSGHIFFKERWYGFDDGLYSACRVLEILSMQPPGISSAKLLAQYPTGLTTPEINITVGEHRKFELIEALRQKADWGQGKLTGIDGIRVDYPSSWGLVRASNTTPVLVLRFEADKPQELEAVQQLFRDQLAAIAPDLELTF